MGDFDGLEGAGEALDLFVCELDDAVRDCEERVIRANSDVLTRADFGAALANEDVARLGVLSCVELGSEALALGIAPITGRAAGFFMCHRVKNLLVRKFEYAQRLLENEFLVKIVKER